MFPSYIFIERPMFIFTTSIVYIFAFLHWQPLDFLIFKYDTTFIRFLFFTLSLLGMSIYFKALYDMHETADPFGYFFMRKVFTLEEADFDLRYHPKDEGQFHKFGLQQYMRFPMQFGLLLMTLFASPVWTFGRLLYSSVMFAGILLSIMY